MSRRIDPNKPLTKADREYLELWSRKTDIFQHEVNLAAREAEVDDDEDGADGFDDDLIERVEAMSLQEIKDELKKSSLKYGGDDHAELANRLLNHLQDERDAAAQS